MATLKLTSSGGGVQSIDTPSTASNFTSTLPGTTGTLLDTNSALASSKLTGALPAISGAALTGIGGRTANNKIINGDFGVNQRAVSGTVSLSAAAYGHDRWKAGSGGATYTFATSANVTTITITAGTLQQVIEGNNLQSGTHTLSWTGTAQGKIGSGSFAATGVTGTATGGTNLTIEFNTGTITKVQLEAGSTASAFEYLQLQQQYANCQRYYQKYKNDSGAAGEGFWGTGLQDSATSFVGGFVFQTPMRIKPTAFETSGVASHYKVQIKANGSVVCSAVPTVTGMTTWGARLVFTTSSGLTAGEAGIYRSNTTAAYVAWSAEL